MGEGNQVRQADVAKPILNTLGLLTLCLFTASIACAQVPLPADDSTPAGKQQDAAQQQIPAASSSQTPPAASNDKVHQAQYPSDAATQPAKVVVTDGRLTVEANNSDLTQILDQVATMSGISIKGMSGGPRVFGVYGPGNAREVLTALLNGSGYNFIMVGGNGVGPPRELILTPRAVHASPAPKAAIVGDTEADDDDGDQPDNTPVPPPPTPVLVPSAGPAPSKDDDDVKRTLERLKVIHDHQQDPPQQDPPQQDSPAPQ